MSDEPAPVLMSVAPVLLMGEHPRSPHWEAFRLQMIEKHPTCASCGLSEHLQAHHIRPFHLYPKLELDPLNIIVLCECPTRHCHIRVGHSWNFQFYNPHVVEDAARELERIRNRLS